METRKEKYQELRKAGKLNITIKKALEIHTTRTAAQTIQQPARYKKIIIPLGDKDVSDWVHKIKQSNKSKKNWIGWRGAIISKPAELKTIDNGQYSRRCRYTHYTYRVLVQSYGYIYTVKGKRVLRASFAGQKNDYKAPRGWGWGLDQNGLFLAKNTNKDINYHITQSDLGLLPEVTARAEENYKTRKEANKIDSLAEKIRLDEVMVCAVDSIRAGNCRAGTERFAEAHRINLQRHIPATVLARIATSDPKRVETVINFARKREAMEQVKGYAELKNHYMQA
jgi:hypothetical protein